MKIDRQRLVFGAFLLVLISVAQISFARFELPAWPAYLSMIFFFVEQMNEKKVPAILIGGAFGIALLFLFPPVVAVLSPLLGAELAQLAVILALVFLIVVLGEAMPMLFNNYAFTSLTVAGVAIQTPNPNPVLWIVIIALGGGAMIAGVLGIVKGMAAMAPKQAPS